MEDRPLPSEGSDIVDNADREFISLLIDLYRDCPELWKVKSKDYFNKNKRSASLEKITRALKLLKPDYTVKKLKQKINLLRTNFNRVFKMIESKKVSGASTDDIPEPTLWYYNDLSFIKDQLEMAPTETSEVSTPASDMVVRGKRWRGAEALQGGTSNGDVMSPQHNLSDNNNDAKKAKLDKGVGKPSRVVHIRNIPHEVTEAEVIHLGIPFGRVTNVLVLKGKNQAFLEMGDEVAASSMVATFNSVMPQIRGRAVYVQFSNHKELKTDQSHSNAEYLRNDRRKTVFDYTIHGDGFSIPIFDYTTATAQAALQAAQAISGQLDTQGGPNTVLRVVIEHMLYSISLDMLYQIFSRYGKVMKIVTFTKNNSFQVLVQYPDVLSAQGAKLALDGQNVYNSCCTLRIEYSKLTSLNVKYNNDKSRDYTNPSLPNGDSNGIDSEPLLPGLLLGSPAAPLQARRFPHDTRLSGGQSVLPSPFAPLHSLASPLAPPFAGTPTVAAGLPLAGFTLQSNAANSLAQSTLKFPGQLPANTCVLLISNLNEEVISPDALFTLFGVYGDVQRVKILYNKKDSALIQMAEPHQANLAILHLDKLKLYGKQMRVMPSKHQTVQMPKEGQPDAGLTKDYTSSNLHRFKKPGSKNYQNIYPPSATLHLSNIPPTVNEEDLTQAFTKAAFTVKGFKFFPKDRKMALLELESIEEAVSALIKMHNHQLSEQNHLRVSFSKSNIQSSTLR